MSRVKVDVSENQVQSSYTGILQGSLWILRAEGLRPFVSRTADALKSTHQIRRCARCLARLPKHMSASSLVDFCYRHPIRPWQVRSEIEELAKMVSELKPRTVLEVGTASGGTLFLWSRLAKPDATIISIDLPGGPFGGGYPVWRTSLYRCFGLPGQTIHLIRADSHKCQTVEQTLSLLSGSPIDFLFIDGDHSYEGVKRDFEIYSALVRKGGVVALHDVARNPEPIGCDVSSFWNEIKRSHPYRELIADPEQGWAGIGLLWV